MHIVQFVQTIDLSQGGITRAFLDLSGGLASRGHRVTILSADPRDCPAEWPRSPAAPSPGLPSVFTLPLGPAPWYKFSPDAVAAASKTMAEADILHLHGLWQPSNKRMASIATSMGKPYVISLHGMLDDRSMAQRALKKRLYHALVEKRLLESARAVHSTAQGELDQSRKWFPGGRGVIVPYLVDLSPYDALPGPDLARDKFPVLRGPGPFILFLSRLHEKKGPDKLIAGASLLRDQGVPFTLLFAGPAESPAYESHLRGLVAKAGLESRTHFLGMVKGQEKFSLYQASDVFVLPTSQENFGLVLIESLGCRTPVVTTDAVDIAPELKQSGGGIILRADPRTLARDLAASLAPLLADRARREEMGRQGRTWTLTALAPDRIMTAMESLYSSKS